MVVETARTFTVKFASDNAFQGEIRRRVDDYFQTTGRRRRDCARM